MKKLLVLTLAVCTMFSIAAMGQDMGADKKSDTGMGMSKDSKPPLMTLKGTVKQDGDKITFVNDADHKSWDVMNPETLKAHVGHHVQLSAHVYADKNTIHVMSVKMLKSTKSEM